MKQSSNQKCIPLVDLKRQYRAIRSEIDEKIREVFESGMFILGSNVESFEKEFASYCGVKYAVGVASGTDALELCIRATNIAKDDEVITVPNTFIATVDAITRNNATPILVDVAEKNYNMDVSLVASKVNNHTRALLPVHLYGNPADMDQLLEISRKENIFLIEDACQAHGAVYNGRRIGSFGHCAAFSFYPTKNLGAYGDGGIIVTNDAELADRLRMLRTYGERSKNHHVVIGYNSRLDEIQAAILRIKLKHLDDWIDARRRVARQYVELLSKISQISLPTETQNGVHSYHLFVIQTKKRNELKSYLEVRGISTGIHYPIPIHLQEAYRQLELPKGTFQIAEKAANQILSLPIFPEMSYDETEYISQTIQEFFSNTV